MIAPAREPPPLQLREQYGLETPEHVEVRFDLAGTGSRAAAAFLDTVVVSLLLILVGAAGDLFGNAPPSGARWIIALVILLSSFTLVGYFAAFEALNRGRTLGKHLLGIRVVMDTGRPVTPTAAIVRNVVRLVDCFVPLFILPGALFVSLTKHHQRLGDWAAGTLVVRDRPTDWSLGPAPSTGTAATAAPHEPLEASPPLLSEDELRLLDGFLARQDGLEPVVQTRLMMDLARRFEGRIPRRGTADPLAYLAEVQGLEHRRRRGRFAVHAQAGAGGRIAVPAERFVAAKRAAWETFRSTALRIERAGLRALPPHEIPAFAARYREIAADLARARTYGVHPEVVEYLERLASAGHNALYATRNRRRTPVGRYLLRDFPAAVVTSWRFVLAALLLFVVPGVIGYVMIREQPELAEEVLPPEFVSRAVEAADRQARGIGYAQSPERQLPVLAAAIISNNVWVAFGAFAGGMLAGIGTVWALAVNGLILGLGLGLFVNYHAGGYLLTFVAGHGVLELTAIFIAGGAGLRLARAIIAPGDIARRDALVVEGIAAAKMLGAVVSLLAVAGTIEGLLSASDAPTALKYAVSAASAVLLVLYFWRGWAYLREQAGPVASPGVSVATKGADPRAAT